jgi:protein-tyrosine-phosphatase
MIKFNVDKAKEIQKDQMRAARKPLLEKLDVDYIVALERGDTAKVAEVAAEKQALRDVTQLVNEVEISSTDVFEATAELKQVWDETLLGENPLTKVIPE